ncbi:MAG: tetratricopeptide repeat protein [Verrucomicrobia bacterium]|nr:tetratricopeptide repeat protein [Verrucomicrobiota bacterium]
MNRSRLLGFKVITVLVVPILLLLSIEAGLRVVGFGYNTDVFVEEKGIVRSNWPFTFKYFPWSMARPMLPVQFEAEKEEGALRIFVLGGSAAQGFPAEEFGIAPQLKVMLEHAYPNRKIEVINAAVTAINSHVVLPVAKACLEYDPDFLVVYVGNNEVVGPHGAGTVFSGFSKNLTLLRFSDSIKSMRLYQLLLGLSGNHRSVTGSWKGMEFFLGNTVYADDERLQTVYKHFASNLDDLIEAAEEENCPVLLSTVAVNLFDNPPFASKKPNHAETEYLSARSLLEVGKLEEARSAYVNARDWDGLRFRADSKLNSLIRERVREHGDKVTLIDSEQRLAKSNLSVGGIPGDALFYDHVHLSFAGNHTVATGLAEAVINELGSVENAPPETLDVARSLAFSDWDQAQIARKLTEQLLQKPPFTNQWNHNKRQLLRKRETRKLFERLDDESKQESARLYKDAVDKKPEDFELKFRYSQILVELGEAEASKSLIAEVLENYPKNHEALMHHSIVTAGLGDFEEANESLQTLRKLNPFAVETRNAYVKLLYDQKRFEEAFKMNESLLDDHPEDPDIRYVHALILKSQGKQQDALEQLSKVVSAHPKHVEARSTLVQTLRERGDISGSLKAAQTWTKSDATRLEAFLAYAEILTEKKDLKNAIEQYRKVIELDPDYVIARSRYIQLMAQEGRIHEAIQFLGTQLQEDPDILEGHSMLGLTLDAVGRKQHAIALLQVGLQRDPTSIKCLRELAWIFATAKADQYRNGSEAVALAKRLVELVPGDPDFRNVLAAAYAETREFQKAIKEAEQGLTLARSSNDQIQIDILSKCLGAYRSSQPIRTN